MLLGALEAGGTKMVCAIGDENGNVFERASFPTRMPEETMPDIIGYFKDKKIEALGISSFGPLNLDETSTDFGNITTTPKPGWANYPLRRVLLDALKVPVGIDTDVNGAALAEARIGIFAVSTFNTDYILVRSADFDRAREALRRIGCEWRDEK